MVLTSSDFPLEDRKTLFIPIDRYGKRPAGDFLNPLKCSRLILKIASLNGNFSTGKNADAVSVEYRVAFAERWIAASEGGYHRSAQRECFGTTHRIPSIWRSDMDVCSRGQARRSV